MTRAEKVYASLCALFVILIVTGNLIYQKFVSLPILPFYTFELSVGAILYPLTFMMTDIIAEFYGKERANFCVKLAIAMNIIIAIMIAGMNQLDATEWSKIDNYTFNKVFGLYSIAFIGSIIACYVAQVIDIVVYLWIRRLTNGKWLWLRSNGSTAISLFIDTCIVIGFLTAFDVLPKDKMLVLIFNSYSFKLFFTICSTPLFYASVALIRRTLKMEQSIADQMIA